MGCASPDGPGDRTQNAPSTSDPPSSYTPTVPVDTGALPACELLVNPSAEDGTEGWSVVDGALNSIGANPGPVPFEGERQFAMGSEAFSMAVQTIGLQPWTNALGTGDVTAHLDAQVRNTEGLDQVWLGLAALDETGQILDEVLSGPFTADHWRLERAHLTIPANTVTLEVRIGGTRTAGTINDATVDALRLCLDEEPPPALQAPTAGPWLMHPTTDGMSVLWTTDPVVIGGVEVREAGGDWMHLCGRPRRPTITRCDWMG